MNRRTDRRNDNCVIEKMLISHGGYCLLQALSKHVNM